MIKRHWIGEKQKSVQKPEITVNDHPLHTPPNLPRPCISLDCPSFDAAAGTVEGGCRSTTASEASSPSCSPTSTVATGCGYSGEECDSEATSSPEPFSIASGYIAGIAGWKTRV